MVSDHRRGDSASGSRISGAASAETLWTPPLVSGQESAHLAFSLASPLEQVGALMLCKIN